MNMKRRFALVGAIILMASLWLSGCNKEDAASSSPVEVSQTVPTVLNLDISKLITIEQVSSALGVTVGEPQVYDSGTVANYATEDAKSFAEISLMECDREKYDSTAALYTDAVDSPNLGDAAKWSAQNKQLLVYAKGYMMGVTIDVVDKNDDTLLVSARHIATLIMDQLG